MNSRSSSHEYFTRCGIATQEFGYGCNDLTLTKEYIQNESNVIFQTVEKPMTLKGVTVQ